MELAQNHVQDCGISSVETSGCATRELVFAFLIYSPW